MRCHVFLMSFQQIRDDGQHQVRRLLSSINTDWIFLCTLKFFFSCIIKLYKNSMFQLMLCLVERKLESGLNIETNRGQQLLFTISSTSFVIVFLKLWFVLVAVFFGWDDDLTHCKYTITSLDLKFIDKKKKLSNVQLITDFLSQVMGDGNSQNNYGQN